MKKRSWVPVVVTVVCVAVVACGALLAFVFAALFRSIEPVADGLGEQLAEHIGAGQAADGYLAAIRDGDLAAFSAVWCADPPAGEGPEDQRGRLEEAKRGHGPITVVTQTIHFAVLRTDGGEMSGFSCFSRTRAARVRAAGDASGARRAMGRRVALVTAVLIMSPFTPAAEADNDNATYKSPDKDADVYVLAGDGSLTRLTDWAGDKDWDAYPDWSPDGRRIAFHRFPATGSAQGTDSEIYVMGSDGSGSYNLSAAEGCDLNPAWSPDGTSMAFHGTRGGEGIQIRVLETGEEIPVTSGNDQSPAWSPDGTRIAFTRYPRPNTSGEPEVWIVDLRNKQLTSLGTRVEFPSWSPDGTQIALASWEAYGDIYVVNADGTNPRRLTDSPGLDIDPDWSPDGTQIVFTSGRDGNPEVYVMSADGSQQTRLTNNPAFDGYPAWSVDGKIAFTSDRTVASSPSESRRASGDGRFRAFASAPCRD